MYGEQGITDPLLIHNQNFEHPSPKMIDSLRNQWRIPISRRFLITKVIVVFIGLGFLIFNSLNDAIQPTRTVDCLIDYFHEWTNSINHFLHDNNVARNILIGFASFLIDFNILALCLRWIWYGKSLRLFFCILVFYVFRGVTQRLFSEKFPPDYIFWYPGFPSLTVPYAPANDFFFSGHVGICTICFLEFYKDKAKVLSIIAFLSIFVEFFTLLVTRKHHFVDMVVGFIIAHYIFKFGLWVDESTQDTDYQVFKLMNSEPPSGMLRKSLSMQLGDSRSLEV